jgi:transcriptional regulator with XRE-family HTH domain
MVRRCARRGSQGDYLVHHESNDRITWHVMVIMTWSSYSGPMARPPVGDLVRDWRTRRRRSQLDLAMEVGVSTRHLSFVETGRSRPSPELLLALAHHLDVPLRERNALLLAGGYAPRYSERTLDDPALAHVMTSVHRMLDAHDPYPGVAIDRRWNVVAANKAALMLTEGVDASLLGPPMNVYRVSLHPDGLARRTTNFVDWASYLVRQLRRLAASTGDPALQALLDEVSNYPNVAQLAPMIGSQPADEQPILMPFRITTPLGELSMFTTLTTFGTPLDVTVDELAIELFFPADNDSDRMLRDLSATVVATA